MIFAGGIYQTQGTGLDYTIAYAGSGIWTATFTNVPTQGPVTVLLP
jgi:hypothetical protein